MLPDNRVFICDSLTITHDDGGVVEIPCDTLEIIDAEGSPLIPPGSVVSFEVDAVLGPFTSQILQEAAHALN